MRNTRREQMLSALPRKRAWRPVYALTLHITRIASGHGLIQRNAGIEGVEILCATDAAQREPAGGDEVAPTGCIEPRLKIRRCQQFAIDRAAHRRDAADF